MYRKLKVTTLRLILKKITTIGLVLSLILVMRYIPDDHEPSVRLYIVYFIFLYISNPFSIFDIRKTHLLEFE